MEHIMNASSLRKMKPIGHFANALNYLKWTSKSGTELATEARHQRSRRPMKKAQENPIVNRNMKRAVVGIIMPFGIFLGLQQPITNIGEKMRHDRREACPPCLSVPRRQRKATEAVEAGHTPPQMASSEGRSGMKCCNSILPKEATEAKHEDDRQ